MTVKNPLDHLLGGRRPPPFFLFLLHHLLLRLQVLVHLPLGRYSLPTLATHSTDFLYHGLHGQKIRLVVRAVHDKLRPSTGSAPYTSFNVLCCRVRKTPPPAWAKYALVALAPLFPTRRSATLGVS